VRSVYNYFRDYDPATGRYVQSDPIGLDGGANPYIYAYDDPLRFADPTGEIGLAGAGYGLIAGGISGYISSGGKWQGAVTGGVAGAAVGAINPFSSTLVGAAAGGLLASAAGQVGGNFVACRDDVWSIDWDLAIVSGVGGGVGRGFATYLVQPRRSAFTYAVSQRMGPGNPVALQSFQATIRGGTSGMAQLGYKSAFYPAGYPPNQCIPQDPCGYPR